jgi:hypothetical protein
MIIALDFDETYTADSVLWNFFITKAIDRGHTVTFVTFRDSRYGNHDIKHAAELLDIDIVFTAGKQKRHVFKADIWIDDMPELLPTFEELGNMYDGCLANNDCKVTYEDNT